ncbi:hypothetical protein PFISCL1PPCAC_7253, partial [Pristionchus fissidentatus]
LDCSKKYDIFFCSYAPTENKNMLFDMSNFNPVYPLLIGYYMSIIYRMSCENVLNKPGLMEKLRNEKFDVYITENLDLCGTAIGHAIAPKSTIGALSSSLYGDHFEDYGIPEALSYRPSSLMSSFDAHSFYDRALNIYARLLFRIMNFWFNRRTIDGLMRERFGTEYPSIAKQSANVANIFTNSEPLIDFATPTLSRVI